MNHSQPKSDITNLDPRHTYNYNEAGRLTSSSDGATYDHDPAGNLTSISGGQQGTWTYAYDALSRMTSAEGGTQSITYGLDALGRTVSRTSAGSTTNYFYQDLSEQPVQVSGQSGTTDIVWALGEPLVQKQGGATRFFGTTPHRDVAYLADDTGTIKGTRTYSPYGEVRSNTGEDSTLGYQSDLTDPDSDLVDMGARQYHSGLGRFTSTDPVLGDPGTPLSMNRHAYAHADPMSNTDPTGLYIPGQSSGSHSTITQTKGGKELNSTTVSNRADNSNVDYKRDRFGVDAWVPTRPKGFVTAARRLPDPFAAWPEGFGASVTKWWPLPIAHRTPNATVFYEGAARLAGRNLNYANLDLSSDGTFRIRIGGGTISDVDASRIVNLGYNEGTEMTRGPGSAFATWGERIEPGRIVRSPGVGYSSGAGSASVSFRAEGLTVTYVSKGIQTTKGTLSYGVRARIYPHPPWKTVAVKAVAAAAAYKALGGTVWKPNLRFSPLRLQHQY